MLILTFYKVFTKHFLHNRHKNIRVSFLKNIFKNLFIGCAGSSLPSRHFFSCGEQWLLSSCGAWVSHCGGFSCAARALCTQALQLRCVGSVVVAPGLQSTGLVLVAHEYSCSVACGVFPDQGSNPSLLHWQADALPLSYQGSPGLRFLGVFLNLSIKLLKSWVMSAFHLGEAPNSVCFQLPVK